MSETEDVTVAVVDWVLDLIPELQSGVQHAAEERGLLPDVAVETVDFVVGGATTLDPRLAKLQQLQQQKMKVWTLDVFIVVNPDPGDVAEGQLKDFADRLDLALRQSKQIGAGTEFIGETLRASFRPPFVEFDDGTRGRVVTLSMQVGKLLEVS